MQTILVTGANGQLGQDLQKLSKHYNHFQFVFTTSSDLDISDEKAVEHFAQLHSFDYCINCAAYTAVDKAESDPVRAQKVNVEGVKNIAKACLKNSAILIQLSTDYVYHNNHQNRPFREDDATSPQGVYAVTKLKGDEMVLAMLPHTLIVRTSWVYSSFGHNFVKTMLRLGKNRDSLNVIYDQIGSPTYAKDLAQALLDIVQKIDKKEIDIAKVKGIYHYSNEGVTSWYDFAKAIFDIKGIRCEVHPIETKDYPTPAKRPPFSLLNKSKIKVTFGLKVPYWRESLKACLELL